MSTGLEAWYASWGTKPESRWDLVLAHIRTARPTTRLWFDTIMPLTVMLVLTRGALPVRNAMLFLLTMNLVHLAATFFNDVQDAAIDRRSSEVLRRTRPIATGVIPRRLALLEAGIITAVAVFVSALIGWKLALLCVVISGLIALHELPPLRTQSRPILSPVAGVIGLAAILLSIVTAAGVGVGGRSLPFLIYVAIYMGLAEMLVKDIRDVDSDAAGGKTTTAVRYGPARATRIAAVAYLVAAVPWAWFVVTYPVAYRPALWVGSVVLGAWIVATAAAARRLQQGFAKEICRFLHRGSVTVFTLVNLTVIAAVSWPW